MVEYVKTYPDGVRLIADLHEACIRIHAEIRSTCYDCVRRSRTLALDVDTGSPPLFDKLYAETISAVPELLAEVRAKIAEERRQVAKLLALVRALRLAPVVKG
jgi:hypothetical protein